MGRDPGLGWAFSGLLLVACGSTDTTNLPPISAPAPGGAESNDPIDVPIPNSPADQGRSDMRPAGGRTATQLGRSVYHRITETEPPGELESYVLAPKTCSGRIVGAYWSGTEEIVALIDPLTRRGEEVGALGDLQTWSGQLAYDDRARVAYAFGTDPNGATHLYSLSIDSGASTSVLIDRPYVIAGMTDQGRVIGADWDAIAGQEIVRLIDPVSGATEGVGVLGDLQFWTGQLIYEEATDTLHAIGQGAAPAEATNLYTLSIGTGASTQVELPEPAYRYSALKVTDQGRLIAAYWDGADERVVALDPVTGATSDPIGVLGDLQTWFGHLAYDPAARVVYTIGYDPNQELRIYHVEL